MFEGYEEVEFMVALKTWDRTKKIVKCIYMQQEFIFGTELKWRQDFAVNGGMILNGQWFVQK